MDIQVPHLRAAGAEGVRRVLLHPQPPLDAARVGGVHFQGLPPLHPPLPLLPQLPTAG